MKAKFLIGLLPLALIVSCNNEEGNGNDNPYKSIPLSRSEQEISDAQMDFSYSLVNNYSKAVGSKVNWVISPYSVFVNFSMLLNGVGDEYVPQFKKGLHFSEETGLEEINEYNKKMINALVSADKKSQLVIKNTNWLNQECTLVPQYSEAAEYYYDAPVKVTKLKNVDENSPIVAWMKENLGSNYFGELWLNTADDLVPNSVSFSLLKFNGEWRIKFDPKDTKEEDFKNIDGTVSRVKMMHYSEEELEYAENEECQLVKILYGNGAFSFDVFLPKGDLKEFVENFTAAKYSELTKECSLKDVNLSLPKFTVYDRDDAEFYDLIGMRKEKVDDNVDIMSNYYKNPVSSLGPVSESELSFSIDENGAKVETKVVSGHGVYYYADYGPVIDFKVNRPFFYTITERSTGAVILSGAMYQMASIKQN